MSRGEAQTSAAVPLMDIVRELYPLCRSITGDGVRRTLEVVARHIDIDVCEVPTGTKVFDWVVPREWNIRDAYIESMDGERIVDFRESNLHVMSYSVPVDAVVAHETLDSHLYSLPKHPDWIPYRTSYYHENWGFCLEHRKRQSLRDARYHVRIDTELKPGSLTYAECRLPGKEQGEFVLYTHTCHPSLVNDNLSGIAVTLAVARALAERPKLRYSYTILFGPGTIGSITWLSENHANLGNIAHGLVLGLLGDPAPHAYKRSRNGCHEVDLVAAHVLNRRSVENRLLDFEPYGYDERQFGSPGIDLPVGRLTRSSNGEYPEYHTSADDLSLVTEERLRESVEVVLEIIDTIEENRRYINQNPYCEPQLGKRGLFRPTGGTRIADRESAMLWLLNQSDATNTVLDIAKKSGIGFDSLTETASELIAAGLLREDGQASEEGE